MDAAEYDNLERVERVHWYYAGKRRLVREWLERIRPPVATDRLLDCGAGTGLFAQEMAACCEVFVLDDHEESIRRLRTRFPADRILPLAGDAIPLPAQSLDYVTALDVLEHVPDDRAVVAEFARVLRPGGIAAVTVPASRALWSEWDVVLHHHRRYDRAQLRALFPDGAWELVHVNYTNVVVYPAVWLIRRWRELRRRLGLGYPAARTEDRLPPRWLNGLLRASFTGLARSRLPFPFGVSLVLVARRR
jgi:SAM-dependent methyltransferase